MNKQLIAILVLVVIVVFGVWAYKWKTKGDHPESQTSNSEMLLKNSSVQIISESDVKYFEGASGYFARPLVDGNYPGIVMIHENRGLNSGVRSMADQMAREGYMVLAVDLLGKSVETQAEAQGLTANYNQETGIKNMRAAVAYLRSKGATKIASLGWCFGGAQSLQLSLSGEPLDATVIYYGRLLTKPEELTAIKWPVLGIFGSTDQVISVESVNQFDSALETIKVPNEIYIYEGVGHAFANPSGANYAPEETKDAWEKTTVFLRKYLQN